MRTPIDGANNIEVELAVHAEGGGGFVEHSYDESGGDRGSPHADLGVPTAHCRREHAPRLGECRLRSGEMLVEPSRA